MCKAQNQYCYVADSSSLLKHEDQDQINHPLEQQRQLFHYCPLTACDTVRPLLVQPPTAGTARKRGN